MSDASELKSDVLMIYHISWKFVGPSYKRCVNWKGYAVNLYHPSKGTDWSLMAFDLLYSPLTAISCSSENNRKRMVPYLFFKRKKNIQIPQIHLINHYVEATVKSFTCELYWRKYGVHYRSKVWDPANFFENIVFWKISMKNSVSYDLFVKSGQFIRTLVTEIE